MDDRLQPGPYRTIQLPGGASAPFYILPFDKQGTCEGPQTRDQMLDAAAKEGFSDVFFFSHGWNNDWSVAVGRYESFLRGFMDMRARLALPVPQGYRPLLCGVFWPSTALVFGEDETGPKIAGADASDAAIAEERNQIREIADDLDASSKERFYELAQKPRLTASEVEALAKILAPLYDAGAGEGRAAAPDPVDLVKVWEAAVDAAAKPIDLDDFGAGETGRSAGPQVAGFGDLLGHLDPRPIIRMMTVWKMKTRAGTVGANGVHSVLVELLRRGSARLHMIGHSFGAKVVLSAVGVGDSLPRKVASMLLLQPAVSHLCFAENVPGTDQPGGYRPVLQRVERPILSTFSANDAPLTKIFHLAVRRKDDLGEARIAAPGEPPSRYAALGGFGPRGCGEQLVDILDPGTPYAMAGSSRIYGVRGTRTIGGHGDVSNDSTWWALHCLAAGGATGRNDG